MPHLFLNVSNISLLKYIHVIFKIQGANLDPYVPPSFGSFMYSIIMAAKMADLCTKRQIFLSAVHKFYCNGLIFSYVSLLTIPWNILKFCLFAYSIWPPKWPNYAQKSIFSCLQSTVFIVWVSNFHIYLCLRSHRKSLTFGAFAHSTWPPKWPNIFQQCWLQAEKCAFST